MGLHDWPVGLVGSGRSAGSVGSAGSAGLVDPGEAIGHQKFTNLKRYLKKPILVSAMVMLFAGVSGRLAKPVTFK